MLVVMEHRDLHALLELRFDVEALGRLDVLQIDAAEGRFERSHCFDDALDGVGRDLDVEHVDPGKLLEQDRLAFHHRLRRQRPDIAEAEHGGAVRHHSHEIGAARQRRRFLRIGGDRFAGGGNTRRIGKREVALIAERLGRLDLELSGFRQAVIGERSRIEIF